MLMYTSWASYGQQRDTVKLYFRFDSFTIDSTFNTNAENLERLATIFSSPQSVRFVYVDVSTSPEGWHDHNVELSDNRLQGIRNCIVSLSGGKLMPEYVTFNSVTENWEGLIEQVDLYYFRHDRDRILKLLANPRVSGARKWQIIQSLNEGYSWKVIQKNYLPVLRYAEFDIVTWRTVENITISDKEFFHARPLTYSTIIPCAEVEKVEELPQQGFRANLRSNLLLDLAMIPNVGLEFHLGKRWSMGATWAYSWWDKSVDNFFWRAYGGEVNLRKYFGRKIKDVNLSGHHLGVYGHAFTYDFEVSPKGQLSELTFGAGLDYGYSVPLCRRLNLDFSIGFGYLTGEYKLYEFDTDCYVWQETRQRHWVGPTKAEISLVWNIGKERVGRR